MDWNYFKIRRNVTLKDFVEGTQTESEALQRFTAKRLTGVPHDEIKELFTKKPESLSEATAVSVDTEENTQLTKVQTGKKSVKNATENVPE